jgi:hypothetical protein
MLSAAKHLYAVGETLRFPVERGETALRVTTFHPRNTSRNAATTFSMSFGAIQ